MPSQEQGEGSEVSSLLPTQESVHFCSPDLLHSSVTQDAETTSAENPKWHQSRRAGFPGLGIYILLQVPSVAITRMEHTVPHIWGSFRAETDIVQGVLPWAYPSFNPYLSTTWASSSGRCPASPPS